MTVNNSVCPYLPIPCLAFLAFEICVAVASGREEISKLSFYFASIYNGSRL